MEDKEKSINNNFFEKWFLNNKFSIILLNILLFFLIIFIFNKISFILNPFWAFFNAILPPILLASIQFYLMNPLVDFLEKKFKVPRVVTIIAVFLFVVILLIWIINSIIPIIQNQTTALINNWPKYWNDAQKDINRTIHDPRLNSVRKYINDAIAGIQKKALPSSNDSLGFALNNISSAVSVVTITLMTLLTAPFVLFFMLKDGHKFKPFLASFVPKSSQENFSSLLHDINYAVSSYVRGQITVAFWVGIMFTIGYLVIGLQYGITLAILAGFLNMIPYFGTFIAFIPAIIISILDSPMMLVKVLIVFAIEQTIESRFVSPLVMGNKMNMNPVTTILLLIGASAIAGLVGVIFAIPVYAVVKIIVTRIFNYYKKASDLYEESDASNSDIPDIKV